MIEKNKDKIMKINKLKLWLYINKKTTRKIAGNW